MKRKGGSEHGGRQEWANGKGVNIYLLYDTHDLKKFSKCLLERILPCEQAQLSIELNCCILSLRISSEKRSFQ